MALKSKLRQAIKIDKGKSGEKERQRLLRLKAEKRKRQKGSKEGEEDGDEAPELVEKDEEEGGVKLNGGKKEKKSKEVAKEDEGEWEDEDSEEEEEDEEEEDEDEEDDDASIALSDLSDIDEDVIPHHTLTINNTAALRTALSRIEIPKTQPFSTTQALTVPTPKLPTNIHDDLARELAFYTQALDATTKARTLLKKEGIPFSRPTDFFAEMVKSDEHMGLVKGKLLEIAANKKAAQDARKLRDAKKFGKKVQQEKLAEREKDKKKMLEKIEGLKRSMYSYDTGRVHFLKIYRARTITIRQPQRARL